MLPAGGAYMVDVAIVGAGQTKYGNHQLGMKGMWAEAEAPSTVLTKIFILNKLMRRSLAV